MTASGAAGAGHPFSTPVVCVWPTRDVRGWSGEPFTGYRDPLTDEGDPPVLPVAALDDALGATYHTDAHATGVVVPDGEQWVPLQPRIRKAALHTLAEAGQLPRQTVMFVDLDLDPHKPWPTPSGAVPEASAAAAAAVLTASVLCPTASVYSTAGGLRLVWSLATPVPVVVAVAWVEAWLAELRARGVEAALSRAASRASGVDLVMRLDPTSAEWWRCFRLPRVYRDGRYTDPIVDDTAARRGLRLDWMPVGGLEALTKRDPGASAHAGASAMHLGGEVVEVPDLDDLPDLTDADWTLLAGTEGIAPMAAPGGVLREGRSHAGPGQRDASLVRGIGLTCRALLRHVRPPSPPDDPGEIRRAALDLADRTMAVWYRSIAASIAEGADPGDLGKAWRMAVDFAFADVAEGAADLTKAAERARAKVEPETADPGDQVEAPAAPVVGGDAVAGGGRLDLLSGVGGDLADLPAVVVVGSQFCVLDTTDPANGYGQPVPAVALVNEIKRRAPGIPRQSSKGIPYPAARIVARDGAVAAEVVARYAAPGRPAVSTFDTRTCTLHRVVASLLPVEPRRDPEVEAWLVELAGGEAAAGIAGQPGPVDLLLDWLATAHVLDRATTALYLRGTDSTGKTLFARGVASCWSDAPIGFREATSQFNAGLLKCPIVHLSEGVDGGRAAIDGASAAFRSLTGDRTHTVRQLYQPFSTLIGHPRVIVGANNDDALPLGKRHHTRDDLDGIAKRVLYLRSAAKARDILAAVPPHRLAAWGIRGGVIARHVAYLVATRGAAALARAGTRFLVGGVEAGWHRALLLRSGANEQTLAAVAEATAKGPACSAVQVEVADDGNPNHARVWVNVSRLHRAWRGLVDEDGVRPERSLLARTIRDLSPSDQSTVRRFVSGRDMTTFAQVRCWDVPGDLVLSVAEGHGLTTVEAIRWALAGQGAPSPDGSDTDATAPRLAVVDGGGSRA